MESRRRHQGANGCELAHAAETIRYLARQMTAGLGAAGRLQRHARQHTAAGRRHARVLA
jgi:hypothetical protein